MKDSNVINFWVDCTDEWKEEYGRNVEKEFWPVLFSGIADTVTATKGKVEDFLFPETVLIGFVRTVWGAISNIYDFEMVVEKEVVAHELFDQFVNEGINSYAVIIKNSPALKKFLTDRIKKNSLPFEETKYFFNTPSIVLKDLYRDLFEKLADIGINSVNMFGLSIGDKLDKAVEAGSIITLSEIIKLALDVIKDPSKLPDRITPEPAKVSLAELRDEIGKKIQGQDVAVGKFMEGYFESRLTSEEKESPEGTFLFVGPPGVGKTYLAKIFSELVGRPYKVYQMNEYAHDSDYHGLVGFERTWRDAAPGVLTNFVRKNPDAILVFDEIEKAHVNTLRQFLSILEGGVLRDLYYDRDIDFRKTVCIFTTNAGRDFYEDNRERLISSIPEETIIDAMKKERDYKGNPVMPTEFLSRLAKGHIIGFDHMDPVKLLPIIRDGLEKGAKIIEKRLGITMDYDPVLLSQIFLFTHGAQLDARVASAKSSSYITEMVYRIIDQEESSEHADNLRRSLEPIEVPIEDKWRGTTVTIDVDDEDDIVKSYLIPDRKRNIIFIARKAIRDFEFKGNLITEFNDINTWYAKDDDRKKEKIRKTLDNKVIDAICIDPFFGGKDDEEENYEGVLNTSSRAMDLLKWIMEQPGFPPVYILITDFHSELMYNQTDRDALKKLGVAGFVRMDRSKINELSLDLFLSGKLSNLVSKGRILAHAIDYKQEGNGYSVKLREFSEKTSMDTEAAGIFVNDTSGKSENGFDKVIGAENAKQVMRNFVRFLKDPVQYQRSGQSVSKGILLYGPPGTGKTMLAKALASEADCPFIPISGADITSEKSQNTGNDAKVHDIAGLFRLARKYAPSVLFIDEIDAFAKQRESNTFENVSIINKLLTEMDGFSDHRDKPVFVVAATNMGDAPGIGGNKIYLDKALLRRFTSRVYVDLPDDKERLEFLKMRKEKLAGKKYGLDDLDDNALEEISRVTMTASLAEIENAITIAQGKAAEEDAPSLSKQLLIDTFEEMKFGEKIKNIDDHIKTTVYHEAGHAFMSFQAEERFWPDYASVVGRGDFLGVVHPREDTGHGFTRRQLIDHIRISLAGRAAEIVFCGNEEGISAGASNDLLHATSYAWDMICTYGMEEGFMMSMPVNMETILSGPLSDKYTSKVNEILERELKYTTEVIEKNKDDVKRLGDELLTKSRLNMEEMKSILGL